MKQDDYQSIAFSAKVSDFCQRLEPVGRILEEEGWHVWCCSPIYGPDGKVHVFFSRWPLQTDHKGWLTHSEIAHAVADCVEGPYTVLGTVLKGRGSDHWDAVTIHNPTVHKVGDKYYLFYIGNRDGTAATQRIGLAVADSLDAPWARISDEEPLLDVSLDRSNWDSYITSNPALLINPDGKYWLYYKAWDRYKDKLRKMGMAFADNIEGPYIKHPDNPLVDFSSIGAQVEDPYVFMEDGRYHMIMRDMGVFNSRSGLYLESKDGIHWSAPMVAYLKSNAYFDGEVQRFERPQVLMRDGQPEYLFLALMGGKYNTSSGAVLKINK